MNILEMRNRLALETVKTIFQNGFDVVFIGGTALNTFYLNYRFSEDLDIGYLQKNHKSEIEELLKARGYIIEPTNLKFRDIITFEGTSLKMDIIEYRLKYKGFVEKAMDATAIKTLALEEFTVEKVISFFTREEISGLGRDAYDLFAINKMHKLDSAFVKKTRGIIKKNIVSIDHNIGLFEHNMERIGVSIRPYLKIEPFEAKEVLGFLKQLGGWLR